MVAAAGPGAHVPAADVDREQLGLQVPRVRRIEPAGPQLAYQPALVVVRVLVHEGLDDQRERLPHRGPGVHLDRQAGVDERRQIGHGPLAVADVDGTLAEHDPGQAPQDAQPLAVEPHRLVQDAGAFLRRHPRPSAGDSGELRHQGGACLSAQRVVDLLELRVERRVLQDPYARGVRGLGYGQAPAEQVREQATPLSERELPLPLCPGDSGLPPGGCPGGGLLQHRRDHLGVLNARRRLHELRDGRDVQRPIGEHRRQRLGHVEHRVVPLRLHEPELVAVGTEVGGSRNLSDCPGRPPSGGPAGPPPVPARGPTASRPATGPAWRPAEHPGRRRTGPADRAST